jgi:CO dehydrogenase maturation factor
MLLVVEPYFKSLETGRRMAALGRDLGLEHVALIANKMRGEADLEAVREFAQRNELEVGGIIPYDEAMPGAERAGSSPLDFAPDGAAVAAIEQIARGLVDGSIAGNGAARV